MDTTKRGACAVIFRSIRNGADAAAYAAAATAMFEEAARQPGYLGVDSVHDADGNGITISYWRDEAAVLAWRNHEGHAATRDKGRLTWYDFYEVVVADVTRDYRWRR